MNKALVYTLKAVIAFAGLVILALCIFWLPYVARIAAVANPEVAYLKYPILIGIYLTCIPFFIGIFQTFKLLSLINRDNAFTKDACKSLRTITMASVSVIILYIIGFIILNAANAFPPGLGLLGLIIIFASFVIAVFAEVLRALLIKVVHMKDENDLTV